MGFLDALLARMKPERQPISPEWQKAIDLLAKEQPDILKTDIQMGELGPQERAATGLKGGITLSPEHGKQSTTQRLADDLAHEMQHSRTAKARGPWEEGKTRFREQGGVFGMLAGLLGRERPGYEYHTRPGEVEGFHAMRRRALARGEMPEPMLDPATGQLHWQGDINLRKE